jgi:hypothetical protein
MSTSREAGIPDFHTTLRKFRSATRHKHLNKALFVTHHKRFSLSSKSNRSQATGALGARASEGQQDSKGHRLSMDSLLAYVSSSSDSDNEPDQLYAVPTHHVVSNVSGLFPTFVYFPVAIDAPLRVTIDDALDAVAGIAAAASPLVDLHVTVSGTLMLRRDQVSATFFLASKRIYFL